MRTRSPLRIGEPQAPTAPRLTAEHGGRDVESVAPSAGALEAGGIPPPKADRRSRHPRWLEEITRPRIAYGVVGLSVCLLAFAAGVASLSGKGTIRRPADAHAAVLGSGPGVSPEALEELRREADRATARLVEDRAAFRAVLEELEERARRRDWRMELTVAPPYEPTPGLPQIVAYPVSVRLGPVATNAAPGFPELVEWLEESARLRQAVEVTGLEIEVPRANRASIRVDLRVYGRKEHDATDSR